MWGESTNNRLVTGVTGHFRTVQVVQAATVFPKNIKGRSWWEIDSAYNLEISLANAPKNTIQGSSLGIDPPCKLLTLCFQIRSLQFSLTLTANSQRTRSYSIFAQKLASQAERIPTSTTRNVCASPYEIKTFRSSVGQVMAENNCKPGKMQIFQQWSAVGGNRKRDTRQRICGISSPTNHRARSDLRFSPPKTSLGRVDCFRTFDLW